MPKRPVRAEHALGLCQPEWKRYTRPMTAPAPPVPGPAAGATAIVTPVSGRFVAGVHHYPVRVFFEDTDAGGVVYHANYLRFMERARSDMLRVLGIDQRGAMDGGEGVYAVTHASLDYRLPARLEDDLVIESRVADLGAASCTIDQRVLRAGTLLVSARVKVAFLTPQGRPRRQPAQWVALFQSVSEGEAPAR